MASKEKDFQRKLIAHLEKQVAKGIAGAAHMLKLAKAKQAKDKVCAS